MDNSSKDRSIRELRLRNEQAEEYDDWYMKRGGGSVLVEDSAVKKALNLKKSDILLDVGCGTGRLTQQLSKLCNECWALDLSDESIRILETKKIANLHTLVADVTSDGIPIDLKFDKILSMQMLQHILPECLTATLEQIKEHLKPNGLFVAELYNYDGLIRREEMKNSKTGKIVQEEDFYEYRFSPQEFVEICELVGFRTVKCYGICNLTRDVMNRRKHLAMLFDDYCRNKWWSKYIGYYFIAVFEREDRD